MDLSTPLTYVKGVGPQRAVVLENKGLLTVEDLLAYLPMRYEDRSNTKPIAQLAPGEMATVTAEVRTAGLAGFKRRNLGLFEAAFSDESAAMLRGKWFHGAYLSSVLLPGLRVALYGKVELDNYTGDLVMMHPEFEILSGEEEDGASSLYTGLHTGRVVPIYEAAGKITTRVFRTLLKRVLDTIAPIEDPLPAPVRERLTLLDRWTATNCVHFPSEHEDLRLLNAFRSRAHLRLIFEEFFWLECGLALKRTKARLQPGIAFELNDKVRERIKAMLPFKPTGAQKRVLAEIAQDMASPHPMNRLLQGDVGSGKTIVAAEAAIIAIENGYQAALLA
ncbi:MAG: ATP-dependent DNA helicase RecG, partial [Bryobacteraceae bacterium]